MNPGLVYVHDPMCSWCFGFENTRSRIFEALAGRLPVERLLGGLAPDSDEPMPEAMRQMLQQTWQRIEQTIPGTRFNFDFWRNNEPRRSTYPSNRAVIAARRQGEQFDEMMTARIQRAYYEEAKNPSDDALLVELAADLGLEREQFESDLNSMETREQLLAEIGRARSLGINSFPSLAVRRDDGIFHIALDYNDPQAMLRQIQARANLD